MVSKTMGRDAGARSVSPDEKWTDRAAACELLAMSFRYPDRTLTDAVASGEWASAAREIAEALDCMLPEDFGGQTRGSFGKRLSGSFDEQPSGSLGERLSGSFDETAPEFGGDALLHALRQEATRLFIGAPTPAVSPFEGVHRAEADGVQPLLFVNPHSMDVERFCRSCGLGRPEGTNEPLDHVATEFELLQYLASCAAGIATPAEGAPEEGDVPGGSFEGAYREFVREHVMTWVPEFARLVAQEARLPFYRDAALLLEAFVERESRS